MNEQILWNRPQFPAQLNMAHPLTKGIVGCWVLNDTGGLRAWDSSPYGNHGLLTNFTDPVKRSFNGLQFDGTNDYVNCPMRNISLALASMTVVVWKKDIARSLIFGKGVNLAGRSITLTRSGTDTYKFTVGGATVAESGGFNDIGIPIFIGCTYVYPSNAGRLYRNGLQVGADTGAQTYDGTGDFEIGAFTSASEYHNGVIYCVYVYNRVLTASEIQNLYEEPYQMFLK